MLYMQLSYINSLLTALKMLPAYVRLQLVGYMSTVVPQKQQSHRKS